jgi:hypothetical protein
MSSMTGYIQYLKFVAGTDKGGVTQGTLFNDPFRLGAMNDARANYTGSRVAEDYTVTSADATAHKATIAPVWGATAVEKIVVDGIPYEIVASSPVADKSCTVTALTGANAGKFEIGFNASDTKFVADKVLKFGYVYDNVYIPQDDLPTLNAKMEGIALEAKARRIAIYYSQMAAFQLKTETGTDLGEALATQACSELAYEIDTEVVKLLDDNAGVAAVTFNRTRPNGISLAEHYEGFAEVIERASQIIYDKTQKHAANYMVIASDIKPILALMRGWNAASTSKINGPYFAGTLNGVKVFVSPALAAGRFFLGFNGEDLITSAAVYAPYMAIVPTQLLGFADGAMSQGFSTLYDLKMLNPDLLVAGAVVTEPQYVDVKNTPQS